VQADGTLANSRLLADGIGSGKLEIGDLVDGMKLDERGNVWVTGPGGVCVFNPEGEHIGTVEVPENVGNVNWARPPGGSDWNWLMIPATTSVYRIQTKVSGNRLPYMR
jgi:gluconolactonase